MRISLVILLFLCGGVTSYASHIMGGEITWSCAGAGRYEFELVIYRDCEGLDIIDPSLRIEVWGHPSVNSISCNLTEQIDLSPNCTEVPGGPLELDCGVGTSGGTGAGAIEKYIYTSMPISLPGTPPADGWKFTYDSFSRNGLLTNIATPTFYGLTLWSVMYQVPLSTAGVCNDNSPKFAQDPYVIMCEETDFGFDPNCFDPDNDELKFSWGKPLDHFPSGAFDPPTNPAELVFEPGFSTISPTPDQTFDPGNIPASMDEETGIISFTSKTLGNFALVQRIDSYRDGERIATVNRELQMIVIPCAGYINSPPAITPPFSGATSFDAEFFAGDLINFDIRIEDIELLQDGTPQTVTLNPSGAYFGDGLTDPNMGCEYGPCATLSTAPVISGVQGLTTTFNWQTSCDHLRDANGVQASEQVYSFVLNAQDDYCALPGRTFKTIRIKLKNKTTIPGVDLHCADVKDDGSVELTWGATTNSGASFDSYEIWSIEDGFIAAVANINTESYTHLGAGAELGAKNYYIVTKFGCGGDNGTNSDTLRTMFMNLNDMGDGRINLNWNDSHDPINGGDNEQQQIIREFPVGTIENIGQVPYASNFFLDTIDVCEAFQTFEISIDNNFGCISTSNKIGETLKDQIVPIIPIVQSASVDTTTGFSKIGWNVNPSEDTYGYIVYQQTLGVWIPIDTVWGRLNTSYLNPLSTPDVATESYRITAFDSCFTSVVPATYQTSAFSDPHETMLLSNEYDICTKSVILNWTNYDSWSEDVKEYQIILSIEGGPSELLETVSKAKRTYTHANLYYDANYCYFVKAVSTNNSISFSNRQCQFTKRPTEAGFHYLSTATNTLSDEVEVKLFTDGNAAVNTYEVRRKSYEESDFSTIGSLTPNGTDNFSYFDSDVFLERGAYSYQINLIDTCGNVASESNIATTVFTNVQTDNVRMLNTLSWSAYSGFDGNITGYAIYRGENGVFQSTPVATTLPGVRSFVDNVSAFFDSKGQFCYRVSAIEGVNTYNFRETAFSNSVCTTFEPVVYIPNAFVVNGANSVFLPIISLYNFNSYKLRIFNREGLEIFYTEDHTEGWDGRGVVFNGEKWRQSQGVYVYFVSLEDLNGDVYEYRGTVTKLVDE